MKTTSILMLLGAMLAQACGETKRDDPPAMVGPDPNRDPDPEPARWVTDPRTGEGPAIWVEGSLVEDGRARVSVWAGSLGVVFGYAVTLQHGAARIVRGSIEQNDRLLGDEAQHLVTMRDGQITVGGARVGSGPSDAQLDQPSKLFDLELDSSGARSRIELSKVMVRRSDGAFVAVATSGAELIAGGAR